MSSPQSSTNNVEWIKTADVDLVGNKLYNCFRRKPIANVKQFLQILEQVSTYLLCHDGQNESGLTMDTLINYTGRNETGFIVHAARLSNIEMIKTLLKHNIDINLRSKNGVSAMHYACAQNNTEIAKLLLKNGIKLQRPGINSSNKILQKEKWLFNAIKHNNIEIVKLLIDPMYKDLNYYPFDWNKQINSRDEHLFLLCCEYGSLDCLKYLFSIEKEYKFETKIDIFSKCNSAIHSSHLKGYTGLHMAFGGKNEELIDYLMHHVYDTSKISKDKILDMMYDCKTFSNDNVLIKALKYNGGNVHKRISKLLAFGVDPNNFGSYPQTPIVCALDCDDSVQVLKLLFNEANQFEHCFNWVCIVM